MTAPTSFPPVLLLGAESSIGLTLIRELGRHGVTANAISLSSLMPPMSEEELAEFMARDQVKARFGNEGYELHYNVYGRDGVMGALEPLRDLPGHELCVMVQGVAPTREMAEEVAMIGLRQMFYARLPDVKGTAGSVAFPLDEVLHASPAYRWTLNHTIEVKDPMELFSPTLTEAGV